MEVHPQNTLRFYNAKIIRMRIMTVPLVLLSMIELSKTNELRDLQ